MTKASEFRELTDDVLSARLIETNNIEGTQKSIDVSGDGPNNTGPPVYQMRDEIVAKRITIRFCTVSLPR